MDTTESPPVKKEKRSDDQDVFMEEDNAAGFTPTYPDELSFYVTCPAGLDHLSQEEVEETFVTLKPNSVHTDRGKVYFTLLGISEIEKIHYLRIASHVVWLVYHDPSVEWTDKEKIQTVLKDVAATKLDYNEIKSIWLKNIHFELSQRFTNENFDEEKKHLDRKRYVDKNYGLTENSELNPLEKRAVERHLLEYKGGSLREKPDRKFIKLLFKMESARHGKKQIITSIELSQILGGKIQDNSEWPFHMTNPSLIFRGYMHPVGLTVGVEMTSFSGGLLWRNILFFGRTPTKAPICAALLRLAKTQPGDVVMDPMGGVGCIPIEAATTKKFSPLSLVLGSDNWKNCITAFHDNIRTFQRADCPLSNVQIGQFDVTNFPIRNDKIDVIITDLPFGKKIGTKELNRTMYTPAVTEFARIARVGTGRCVLMTNDRQAINNAIGSVLNMKYWKKVTHFTFNHGNLRTGIWLLQRTPVEFIVK